MSADANALPTPVRLHRRAVSALFFCQGFAFAALITRIPAIQESFRVERGATGGALALIPIIARASEASSPGTWLCGSAVPWCCGSAGVGSA